MDVNYGSAGLRGLDGRLGDLLRRDRAVRAFGDLAVIARDRTGHDLSLFIKELPCRETVSATASGLLRPPRIVEIITPGLMAAAGKPPARRISDPHLIK